MKKLLPLLTGIALLGLVSCHKDHGRSGNEIQVIIKTELSTKLQVRGAGDGDASLIDRYTLLVYADGATTPTEVLPVQTKAEGGNFSLSLSRGHDYTFVVWAYCETGPYTIGNDGVVSLDPAKFAVNEEKLDAFFGSVKIQDVQTDVTETITLKRPFGQLQVEATDYDAYSEYTPKDIEITLSEIYTKFNVLTGEVSAPESNVKCSAAVMEDKVLSFNYLLAPATDDYKVNVGVNISMNGSDKTVDRNVPEVPMKRNYITILSGNILPTTGSFGIYIQSEFETEKFNIGIPVRIAGLNETFPTISAAVDRLNTNPGAGTKIIVTNGIFNEDVTLPAGITLQGAGNSTILKGYIILNAGCNLKDLKHVWDGPASPRTAMYVAGNNVTLENIELEGKPRKAGSTKDDGEGIVTIAGVSDFTVKNCKFTGYWKGIYLNNSKGLSITGSEFANMNPFGVDNFDASMVITGNTFRRAEGDWQQPHLIVTNGDAPSLDPSTWLGGLKAVVNQIINDNIWVGSERIRVQCTSGSTLFDTRVTTEIL